MLETGSSNVTHPCLFNSLRLIPRLNEERERISPGAFITRKDNGDRRLQARLENHRCRTSVANIKFRDDVPRDANHQTHLGGINGCDVSRNGAHNERVRNSVQSGKGRTVVTPTTHSYTRHIPLVGGFGRRANMMNRASRREGIGLRMIVGSTNNGFYGRYVVTQETTYEQINSRLRRLLALRTGNVGLLLTMLETVTFGLVCRNGRIANLLL